MAFIELQFNEYVLISYFVEYPLKKPKSFRKFVTNGKTE